MGWGALVGRMTCVQGTNGAGRVICIVLFAAYCKLKRLLSLRIAFTINRQRLSLTYLIIRFDENNIKKTMCLFKCLCPTK